MAAVSRKVQRGPCLSRGPCFFILFYKIIIMSYPENTWGPLISDFIFLSVYCNAVVQCRLCDYVGHRHKVQGILNRNDYISIFCDHAALPRTGSVWLGPLHIPARQHKAMKGSWWEVVQSWLQLKLLPHQGSLKSSSCSGHNQSDRLERGIESGILVLQRRTWIQTRGEVKFVQLLAWLRYTIWTKVCGYKTILSIRLCWTSHSRYVPPFLSFAI